MQGRPACRLQRLGCVTLGLGAFVAVGAVGMWVSMCITGPVPIPLAIDANVPDGLGTETTEPLKN